MGLTVAGDDAGAGCPEDGVPLILPLILLLEDELALFICGLPGLPTTDVVDDVLLADKGVLKVGIGKADNILRTAGDVCLPRPGESPGVSVLAEDDM